jgi:hypothetical protein
MPCFDRSKAFNLSAFHYQSARNMRFWIIPYKTYGYHIDEVKTPDLIEIDNTFRDLRSMNEEEGGSDEYNSTV